MNTYDKYELPPLPSLPAYSPEVFDREVKVVSETMAEQLMQDYASAAIEADRQRLVMEYSRLDKEWADLRKAQIEADRQSRVEPVAEVVLGDDGIYIEPIAGRPLLMGDKLYPATQPTEPVGWEYCHNGDWIRTTEPDVHVEKGREVRALYTDPQPLSDSDIPTEPVKVDAEAAVHAKALVPSDAEAAEFADRYGVYYDMDPFIAGEHARALLARYGRR